MDVVSNERDTRFNLLCRPETPHFFKVIVQPLDQGIRIPTMFVRDYGAGLGEDALLKVPCGAEWRVELLKIHGEVWMMKGWQEFAEFYSIKKHHFLVFRHEGNSKFHVTIFDKTASEIDYPIKPNKRGRKRVFNGRRLRRRISNESREEASRALPPSSKNYSNLPLKAKIEAYKRDFKSKNPVFICSLPPCCVSHQFSGLNIPISFVRHHLPKNYKEDFELRLGGKKKSWSAIVYVNDLYGRIHGGGWRRFAKDSKLRKGDICLFEMVTSKKIFNIIICERG